MALTGIVLVDKEEDWTSHDVVAKLRGTLGERRIGHAGTLDPLATGLLVVLVGRATRAASYAEAEEKEYLASFRPGLTTDTQDITGRVLARSAELPTPEAIRAVLPRFTGPIRQLPPMYSAIKVNGRKLYEIARRGGEAERTPRPVTICALDYLGQDGEDHLLRVVCSKGTYIRTLCHDIGAALGCGGCMAALRRTRCGSFSVGDAVPVGAITPERLLPLDTLFIRHPALPLTPAQEKVCRCGGTFSLARPEGLYRFYAPDGEFLALGEIRGERARSVKSFFEVD